MNCLGPGRIPCAGSFVVLCHLTPRKSHSGYIKVQLSLDLSMWCQLEDCDRNVKLPTSRAPARRWCLFPTARSILCRRCDSSRTNKMKSAEEEKAEIEIIELSDFSLSRMGVFSAHYCIACSIIRCRWTGMLANRLGRCTSREMDMNTIQTTYTTWATCAFMLFVVSIINRIHVHNTKPVYDIFD